MEGVFGTWRWQPPPHWLRIGVVDMHTGGEPLRVLTGGLPPLPGRTVLEKRRFFREHYDHLRTGLMWEPRGHADMYGAVVTPSESADCDAFFLHNEGYSTMCGHAIIALTKLLLESRLASDGRGAPELAIAVPAGVVHARAEMQDGTVSRVAFRNVAAFVSLRDAQVEVPGIGHVRFDVAYGGAFYAIVEAQPLGLELVAADHHRLIDRGMRIKRAIMEQFSIEHPTQRDLSFLYGTIFVGPAVSAAHHSRNVTIFAEGQVDRSATGTGISARAALHYARGELRLGQEITIESILGSVMSVRVVEETTFGPHPAIIPEAGGTAHVTGCGELCFDPADPFNRGFLLRQVGTRASA